jgi:hypothetical protein
VKGARARRRHIWTRREGVDGIDPQGQIKEVSQTTSLKRALPALRTRVGQRDEADPRVAEPRERVTGSGSSRERTCSRERSLDALRVKVGRDRHHLERGSQMIGKRPAPDGERLRGERTPRRFWGFRLLDDWKRLEAIRTCAASGYGPVCSACNGR